eukprot:Opistho-1_new@6262
MRCAGLAASLAALVALSLFVSHADAQACIISDARRTRVWTIPNGDNVRDDATGIVRMVDNVALPDGTTSVWYRDILYENNRDMPCMAIGSRGGLPNNIQNRMVQVLVESDAAGLGMCLQIDRPITNVDNPPFKACGKGRVRACFRGEITNPSASDLGTILRVFCDNSCPSSDKLIRFNVIYSDTSYDGSSNDLDDWCETKAPVYYSEMVSQANLDPYALAQGSVWWGAASSTTASIASLVLAFAAIAALLL